MKEFYIQEILPASVVVSYVTEFSRNFEACFARLVENGHCCQRESSERRSASDPVRARIKDVSYTVEAAGPTAPKTEVPREKLVQSIKEPRLSAIHPKTQHSPRSESAILEQCYATKMQLHLVGTQLHQKLFQRFNTPTCFHPKTNLRTWLPSLD